MTASVTTSVTACTCGSYVPGVVPGHLAPPLTSWSSWDRYCWAVMPQLYGWPVAFLESCEEAGGAVSC